MNDVSGRKSNAVQNLSEKQPSANALSKGVKNYYKILGITNKLSYICCSLFNKAAFIFDVDSNAVTLSDKLLVSNNIKQKTTLIVLTL